MKVLQSNGVKEEEEENEMSFDGFNFQFKIVNSIAFYQELHLNVENILWQMVNFYYI